MQGGYLSGYRTYILAGLGILSAVAGYATGDLGAVDALQQAWGAVMATTIRSAIGERK